MKIKTFSIIDSKILVESETTNSKENNNLLNITQNLFCDKFFYDYHISDNISAKEADELLEPDLLKETRNSYVYRYYFDTTMKIEGTHFLISDYKVIDKNYFFFKDFDIKYLREEDKKNLFFYKLPIHIESQVYQPFVLIKYASSFDFYTPDPFIEVELAELNTRNNDTIKELIFFNAEYQINDEDIINRTNVQSVYILSDMNNFQSFTLTKPYVF